MIIKSITVGNYKNIAETKLDLSRMIALVSTNNYGKSNLLEAIKFGLEFISASAKIRNNMMHWSRGIPLNPSLAGKNFKFSIEFDDPALHEYRFVHYGYSFSWHNNQNTGAEIIDEIIEMRPSESVRYTSYLKRDKGLYRSGKGNTNFRKLNITKDKLAIDALSGVDNLEIAPVIERIQSLSYRICSSLDLGPSFDPSPIEFDFGINAPLPFDDNDIPRALSVLSREKPDKFNLFLETVYDLFPEFKKVSLQLYTLQEEFKPQVKAIMLSSPNNKDTESTEKDITYKLHNEIYRLMIDSNYFNQPVSMDFMSTGTKRIFWLIANAVFAGCYGTNLLGIDEIETSIHPKMIRNLLESLTDILGDASMIVSSHSPYLVQYLKANSIYVGVPNDEGVAVFKRIQQSKIKAILNRTRELETTVGEYLFELMSGDRDSAAILSAYLEDAKVG